MTSRTLTLATLKKKGACKEQVVLFRKMFGKSVEITEALCVEHAAVFSWGWAAENLLTAAALAEYQRVRAAALAEYQRVTAAALAECERVTAPAWAEYARVTAAALAEYERVKAATWARAYIGDKEAGDD
jgi:cell division septum initiation protein DivIVA